MSGKGIARVFILISLSFIVAAGCVAVKEENYNDKAERYEEKAQKDGQEDEERTRDEEEKAQKESKKTSTYFEKYNSEIKGIRGNKYAVRGTAKLVEDDENAILVTMAIKKDTSVDIIGTIEYKSGEADLYLITPDYKKKCILSKDVIKEGKEIKKTVDLEKGFNQMIFKGADSVVDFDLEFDVEKAFSVRFE